MSCFCFHQPACENDKPRQRGYELPTRIGLPANLRTPASPKVLRNQDGIPSYSRRPVDQPEIPAAILYEDLEEPEEANVDDSDLCVNKSGGKAATMANVALEVICSGISRQVSIFNKTRHRARLSIGKSDEQLARRAELKRLMHKRIQEEIRSEESEDTPKNNGKGQTVHAAGSKQTTILTSGPRDNIEFEVVVPDNAVTKPLLHSQQGASLARSPTYRRNSCPVGCGTPQPDMSPDRKTDGSKRHSFSDLPTARLSVSNVFEGDKTNILSFGAKQSGSKAEKSDSPIPDKQSWDTHSALGIWLIAQGLQSRDNSTIGFDKPMILDAEATKNCKTDDLDTLAEIATTESVDTFATAESPPKSQNLSESKRVSMDGDTRLPARRPEPDESPRDSDSASTTNADLKEAYALAMAYATPRDNSSSEYPSAMPSFQPSPVRSRSQLPKLSLRDLQGIQFSPFQKGSISSRIGNLDDGDYSRQFSFAKFGGMFANSF
ncbi:hypothetical protein B0I35DRAFT_478467 [Stachybotrys elegans]|uniref:Uncharacterized protein n=1 Tax=Stachybotrys elegans TaxID=80388 RepID=A0A8K0ST79_9HYPO|nr:hypothetical protein B0I35DRAFT_478467 [Stachybotrys elegans]